MENYQLTAADFADTGQWRLIVEIGEKGLKAFLENTLHTEIPPQELCKSEWKDSPQDLCKNIEEAVYNCPRLLDDFATKIIISDLHTLFVPQKIAEDRAGSEEELYNKVYQAAETDIMTDTDNGVTAVWCPGPGVKSFLSRTFPGARITCNLLDKIRKYRKNSDHSNCTELGEGVKLFKDIREDEADLILMKGDGLISASTHKISNLEEIETVVKNLQRVYSLTE